MAAQGYLSPVGTPTVQFFTNQGIILAGGFIYTYLAGTTTPAGTFTSPSLSVANSNPIVLDGTGRPPQEIWLQGGTTYKFVLTDSNNNPIATFDNLGGINDPSQAGGGGGGGGGAITSEWIVSTLTPTFVDGTHFSVPGNQTTTFTVNRRIYAVVSAGTIYGTITGVSFSTNTEVTVQWDSGTLDSGLSQVAYGILNPANPSYLSALTPQIITSTTGVPLAPTPGATCARVRMVGGGAAGGGVQLATTSQMGCASGGSAGTECEFWIISGWQALAGTTLTAGAAGVGVSAGNGGNGSPTTFGSIASAPGGIGGLLAAIQSNSSAVGGQAFKFAFTGSYPALATINSPALAIRNKQGQPSTPATIFVSLTPTFQMESGSGGDSSFGKGGNGQTSTTGALAGTGYGAGGGGVGAVSSTTAGTGANGSQGVIIIEEFI